MVINPLNYFTLVFSTHAAGHNWVVFSFGTWGAYYYSFSAHWCFVSFDTWVSIFSFLHIGALLVWHGEEMKALSLI